MPIVFRKHSCVTYVFHLTNKAAANSWLRRKEAELSSNL
jgi:hypothetical protein